jgi:hypothetical protein
VGSSIALHMTGPKKSFDAATGAQRAPAFGQLFYG